MLVLFIHEVIDMSLKHGLLGFLIGQEMSGYDLEKLFSGSIGYFWSAQISQIYRDLHAMEKSGWVQSKEIIQTGRPNKKIFKITDAGQKELENWLIGYNVKNDSEIRIGILMRMFFAARRPKEETIAILEQFRVNCQNALDKLISINQELEHCDTKQIELIYSKATLSYGEKYYQMQIAWSTETIEKLQ
jgi:DNA-binding PadR family transcriptional regulator